MKVHRIEPQILLLQCAGYARKFVGEQSPQIAFFAADHDANFVGVNHGADFHVAERRGVQANPHFRFCRPADHLRHLHRTGGGIAGQIC